LSQYYSLERWLYRLSKSRYSQAFVLKGALMLVACKSPILRATRDIDLLGRIENDPEKIKAAIAEICRVEVPDDGLVFASESVRTMRIAEDADYHGIRAEFSGNLATTRLSMQIDMGFSDVVTPGPVEISYPTILDHPAPVLSAYNRETAIAEKLEAMFILGELNSRMKDFFDIWMLATTSDFTGADLQAAISATFARRGIPISADPRVFADDFALNHSKQLQWAGFLKRMRPSKAPEKFTDALGLIRIFLQPVIFSLAEGTPFKMKWNHPGPWHDEW